MLTLKNAELGTKRKKSYALSSPEIFLSLKRGNLLRPQLQFQESVTPTLPSLLFKRFLWLILPPDPITIVNPAVQSKTISSNNKTEELLKQKLQSNTTKKSQTKTSIE